MLESDDRASAVDMTSTFADKPIPQFWDAERLLGKEVSRSLGIDPAKVSWDIYLFYPPNAEWTDAGLPPPEKVIVQAMGVVLGAKGTLPPKGDQSRLPKWAEGRADVVGEQSELADMLTAIAVPYVEKYRAGQR
ncbi:MAG: hypothetical protein AB7L94_29980 [Kofleriaceae bacterium]